MKKTEQQIQQLTEEFVAWLDEEEEIGCGDTDIVRTAEPAQNFAKNCREYRAMREASMGDMTVTIIESSQRFKGEPRKDLYILDAADCRLVYAS